MAEQEEADTAAYAFYRKLLSWNYYAVMMRTGDGAGAIAELKKVPNTFANAQVSFLRQLPRSYCLHKQFM